MNKEFLESGKTPEEQLAEDIKLKEVKKQMQKVMNMDLLEKVLENNEFIFSIEDIKYKVKKPSFEQKQDANNKRIAKYMELLQHPTFVLEEELRKIYKPKGVDIDAMDEKMFNITKKKEDYLLKLGKAIKDKKPDAEKQAFKKEIEILQQELQDVSIKKTSYLELSIEHQVIIYVYSYLTYLISEKKEKDKWIPVWKTYDEFTRDSGVRMDGITFYASSIISDELNKQ